MEVATLDELEAWALLKQPHHTVGEACRSVACPVARFYVEVRGYEVACVHSQSASVRLPGGEWTRLAHGEEVRFLILQMDMRYHWGRVTAEDLLGYIATVRRHQEAARRAATQRWGLN
jgi:hypothetical protein